MPSMFTLKALGLNTQPNQLEVAEGSLTVAKNVNINRDNVVESRRGYKIYGDTFGSTSDRAKQLFTYKDRILRHFGSTLQYDNGSGRFSDFDVSFMETETGLRVKSIESNGNLYFTTANGIMKLSAKTAADFSTSPDFVTPAGAVKAIDVAGKVKYNYGDQSSFLVQDSAVAYRIVWGYRDLNNNLFLGTPSQRVEVFNYMLTLMLQDYMPILSALDIIGALGSMIDDKNYVDTLKLEISASASDLRTNLIALAAKLDNDILYADNDAAPTGAPLEIDTATITTGVATVTFVTGDPSLYLSSGSLINLTGFTPAVGTLDGGQTIASVTSTTITFNTTATGSVTIDSSATIKSNEYRSIAQPGTPDTPATNDELLEIQDYISFIIDQLNIEPDTVISSALKTDYIQPLDITKASTVLLTISVPEEITSKYFYQIYRSAVFQATGAAVLSTDVFPNDELQLVYEAFPTAAELAAGTIIVEDIVPDAFRGANLYTNASTGEGILQSNDIPPFAKDINVFKNSIFYANTRTRHRKEVSLIGVQNMIDDYNGGTIPTLTISNQTGGFNTYRFILGEAEAFTIQTTAASLLASSGAASYFIANGGGNSSLYYFWYKTGTATDPAVTGRVGVPIIVDGADSDAQVATKTRNALNILNADFIATSATNVVTVNTIKRGYTDDPQAATSGFTINVTNQGEGERVAQEETLVATIADTAGSLAGDYFTANTAFDQEQYYIWFKVAGVGADPAVAGKTGLLVSLALNDSATVVAQKIALELNTNYSDKFTATTDTGSVTIRNFKFGPAIASAAGTSGFTVTTTEDGALDVLLSDNVSPAIAVDETANSLTRVINKNDSEELYSFYTSGAQEVPGKMVWESRNLNNGQFFIIANNDNTGSSFNPTFAPDTSIVSISTGSPSTMLVTTAAPHGLVNLDFVFISGSNSVPSIDGYSQITYISPTTFRLNKTITTAGTTGGISTLVNVEASSNEESKNRVYYSKLQQPESVPFLNYFDIGAKDKAILRIFPLRDSLFVFKEDGLYRISGEGIPFNLALFDNSCILIPPDSVSSVDNVIYGWTRQGISSVTESGVRNVSRPLDVDLLPLASANATYFKSATWGLGYESDKSYTVFTINKNSDTYAKRAYKYNSLTNAWTTVEKDYLCGVIHFNDDKMYVGAGDINAIEQERKDFNREDYADRQYNFELLNDKYFNKIFLLESVNNIDAFDIFIQDQTLTIYDFNMILRKLDIDPLMSVQNFLSTLVASPGDNMRTNLLALTAKLDGLGLGFTNYTSTIADKSGTITSITAGTSVTVTSANHGLITGREVLIAGTDSVPSINGQYSVTVLNANQFTIEPEDFIITPGTAGSFSTQSNDFADLKVCFNATMDKLNLDDNVGFANYTPITIDTRQEILITDVDRVAKRMTVATELDFVVGPFTVYKSIDCEIQYAPNTFGGDPVSLKHMREAQLLFETLTFTRGDISFATDLLPKFEQVPFEAEGNGRFGFTPFGQGFFGGVSHSAPIRTYIPRNCQRCRYMVVKFNHRVAREKWSLFGITLTGETDLSSRAYK